MIDINEKQKTELLKFVELIANQSTDSDHGIIGQAKNTFKLAEIIADARFILDNLNLAPFKQEGVDGS